MSEVPKEASLVRNKECIVVYLKMQKLFEMEGNFKFICKGSELTEEITSGIVEKSYYKNTFKNYNLNKTNHFDNALESFKSAIQANNFHWLENPITKPNGDDYYYEFKHSFDEVETLWDGGSYHEDLFEWQQAEEKTFRNCLLFEIL